LNSGGFDDSLKLAEAAVEQARTTGLHRLQAEALLIAGQDQHQRAKNNEAEDLLIQVVAPAKSSNAPEIELEAYIELVWIAGYEQGRPNEANVWSKLADGALKAGVGGPALEARLLNRRMGMLYRQGNLSEALKSVQRARWLQEKLYPQGHPDLADS